MKWRYRGERVGTETRAPGVVDGREDGEGEIFQVILKNDPTK
jgi:hypothetical protein